MRTTERIRRPGFVEPLRNLPVTLVSLFIVMAGVDVLLVMQPSLVQSLRDDWQSWVHGSISAPWATLVGATATIAGLAIASAMLTVAVRGIAESPYLWLASALVAGCCFMIGRIPVEVPVRMPTPAFAAMSALLLLGGGAFFQSRAALFNMTGVFLTSTPLALLGVGYLRARTSTGAPYVIDDNAQLAMSLLLAASAGTVLISIASRRLRALGGAAALGGATGEQFAELIERARESEKRAAEAEYHLERALERSNGTPRLLEDDELTMGRRPKRGRLGFWLVTLLLLGGGAAAYFAAYLPLEQQLLTQRKLNHEQTQTHASELAALRAELERERLAREQSAQPAEPQPEAAPPKRASKPAAAVGAAPALAPAATKKKLPAATAKPARPPAPAPAPAAAPAPAPVDRALQSNSDDPLEGLDGM